MSDTIPFINKLNAYVNQRQQKINEKLSELKTLEVQLNLRKKEISSMKREYQNTFNEKTFQNIMDAEKKVDQMQDYINKISELVDLMNTGKFDYDAAPLEKEIDSYVEDINFNQLKDAVVAAKNNYLNAIKSYMDKLNEVSTVKSSLDNMQNNINKRTKDNIMKVFNKHSKDFLPIDDMFIDEDNKDMRIRLNHSAIGIYLRSPYGI